MERLIIVNRNDAYYDDHGYDCHDSCADHDHDHDDENEEADVF